MQWRRNTDLVVLLLVHGDDAQIPQILACPTNTHMHFKPRPLAFKRTPALFLTSSPQTLQKKQIMTFLNPEPYLP